MYVTIDQFAHWLMDNPNMELPFAPIKECAWRGDNHDACLVVKPGNMVPARLFLPMLNKLITGEYHGHKSGDCYYSERSFIHLETGEALANAQDDDHYEFLFGELYAKGNPFYL